MIITLIASLVVAVLLFVLALLIRRRFKLSRLAYISTSILMLLAGLPLSLSLYILYFSLFVPGKNVSEEIYPGVHYSQSIVETGSKHAVIHRVGVDLSRVEIRVSPPQREVDQVQYVAKTTSQALLEYGADLAVNASFFSPFRDNYFLDYYPHVGDQVTPLGQTLSEGSLLTRRGESWPRLLIWPSGEVDFGVVDLSVLLSQDAPESEKPIFAVSGRRYLIQDGVIVVEEYADHYPRLVVGLNREKTELWLFVVDGKQPGYSIGLGLPELAGFMMEKGVYDAIELDGGGSATLVVKSPDGTATLLNRPSHTKIPRRERPVANHLLMYLKD